MMRQYQQITIDLPKYRAFASGRERYREQINIDFGRPVCAFADNYRYKQPEIFTDQTTENTK